MGAESVSVNLSYEGSYGDDGEFEFVLSDEDGKPRVIVSLFVDTDTDYGVFERKREMTPGELATLISGLQQLLDKVKQA